MNTETMKTQKMFDLVERIFENTRKNCKLLTGRIY